MSDAVEQEAAEGLTYAELLKDAQERGYREFSDVFLRRHQGYLGSLQLRVWANEEDTAYFINLNAWDHGSLHNSPHGAISVNAQAQFSTEDNGEGEAVNVERLDFGSFEATEEFFARMWKSMGFGHYRKQE